MKVLKVIKKPFVEYLVFRILQNVKQKHINTSFAFVFSYPNKVVVNCCNNIM
jgi:hypothetical protein